MSISITINTDTAAEARQQLQALLGGDLVPVRAVESVNNDAGLSEKPVDAQPTGLVGRYGHDSVVGVATRVPGQPSPGAKRRTKAEIAEDEAAAKIAAEADAAKPATGFTQEQWDADRAAETSLISTGEERVGPEDDAETVAADEADEAAETAAVVEERPADKKLTHDDVRNALGAYVKLYGMAAAQEDGPRVIALALKNPEIVKVSAIPETQEALGAVVVGVEEMSRVNPFKRTKVA